jgi:hypothetical protein
MQPYVREQHSELLAIVLVGFGNLEINQHRISNLGWPWSPALEFGAQGLAGPEGSFGVNAVATESLETATLECAKLRSVGNLGGLV